MKKITLLLIILTLISAGIFSGCTQPQPSPSNSDTPTVTDSDNDGYADNVDDFPTDSNLHERIDIISGSSTTYKPDHGSGGAIDINSDCKFVVVNWEVTNPTDLTEYEKQEIYFSIRHPPDNRHIYYHLDDVKNEHLRFTIDTSNWGRWEYSFGSGFINRSITIYAEFYVLK